MESPSQRSGQSGKRAGLRNMPPGKANAGEFCAVFWNGFRAAQRRGLHRPFVEISGFLTGTEARESVRNDLSATVVFGAKQRTAGAKEPLGRS